MTGSAVRPAENRSTALTDIAESMRLDAEVPGDIDFAGYPQAGDETAAGLGTDAATLAASIEAGPPSGEAAPRRFQRLRLLMSRLIKKKVFEARED